MAIAEIYAGRVSHVRHGPFRHRFIYRVWLLCAELDALDELPLPRWLFGHNRAALLAIHDKDHGLRDGRPLRAYAEQALAAQNLLEYASRIRFMTMPRFLGYAFNPISFYFCYNAAGRLGAVLHQVKNTFGDQIGYLMPVLASGEEKIRQAAPKRMHVSPFFNMRGGYAFTLNDPAEDFTVSIQYGVPGEPRLTAAMALRRQELGLANILRLLVLMPFTPLKVILAIHFEAVKLFIKGAKFHPVPDPEHEKIIAGEAP